MNLEALLLIGIPALIIGAIFYLPFYLWFRWKKRNGVASAVTKSPIITRKGITFYGSMVVVLFLGYAQGPLASDTAFGAFMNTSAGRIIWSIGVVIFTSVIEFAFAKRGHKFVDK
jgi:hypothetical protein